MGIGFCGYGDTFVIFDGESRSKRDSKKIQIMDSLSKIESQSFSLCTKPESHTKIIFLIHFPNEIPLIRGFSTFWSKDLFGFVYFELLRCCLEERLDQYSRMERENLLLS